ncbi:MAG: D-arabinono-1,4-lactone oxidase, partial [Sciscionella sp.]
MEWVNWGHNQRVTPLEPIRAHDVAQVQSVVTRAAREHRRVKVLGSGHSFTGIAVAEDIALRLATPATLTVLDRRAGLVRVAAGMPLRVLNPLLWQLGLCMTNLGDIDAQTVAGAISTGTHGTGAHYRGLADQVRGLDLVLADGSHLRCSAEENAELFCFARLGLGALGIIVSVTLACEPAYYLHASEQSLPLDQVIDRIDELAETNDHFEFFWFPHTTIAATKRNNRAAEQRANRGRAAEWIGDELLGNGAHELACRLGRRLPALVPRINRTAAAAMSSGVYTDRAYKVFTSPRRVRFVEMEYAIPKAAVREALTELRRVAAAYARAVTFPVEVRFSAADEVPLSTAHERDSAYLAVQVYR